MIALRIGGHVMSDFGLCEPHRQELPADRSRLGHLRLGPFGFVLGGLTTDFRLIYIKYTSVGLCQMD